MSATKNQPKKIYRNRPASEPELSQLDKFRDAARAAGTDDSEDAFDRIVKKIAKAPPKDDKVPPQRKGGV